MYSFVKIFNANIAHEKSNVELVLKVEKRQFWGVIDIDSTRTKLNHNQHFDPLL